MQDATKDIRTNLYAGYVDPLPAKRLANLIGTIKAVLIALVALGTLVAVVEITSSTYGGSVLLPILSGVVSATTIYVTFGWLEQTLRLLIGIAYNTAESADLVPEPDADPGDRA
jgi:hypothetical protein